MACHPNLPSLAPHRRDPPPPVVSGQRMRQGWWLKQGRCWIRKFNVDALMMMMMMMLWHISIVDEGFDPCHCHLWDFMGALNINHTPRRLRRVCKKFNARNALHWWNLWLERLVIIIALMKGIWRNFSNTLIQNWPIKWGRWNSISSFKYAYRSRRREIYTVQLDLLRV